MSGRSIGLRTWKIIFWEYDILSWRRVRTHCQLLGHILQSKRTLAFLFSLLFLPGNYLAVARMKEFFFFSESSFKNRTTKQSSFIKYYLVLSPNRAFVDPLQTVLASQGHTIWYADNSAARRAVAQSRNARCRLLAVIHRAPHLPLDCLTAQKVPDRRSRSAQYATAVIYGALFKGAICSSTSLLSLPDDKALPLHPSIGLLNVANRRRVTRVS